MLVQKTTGFEQSMLRNRGDGSFDVTDDVVQMDVRLVTDINGDGRADFVGPDFVLPGNFEVKIAQDDGSYSRVSSPLSFDASGGQFYAGDLDGDGYPEIIVSTSNRTYAIYVDGAGNIVSTETLGASSLEPIPDLDGDGRAELYEWNDGSLAITGSRSGTTWSYNVGSYDLAALRFTDLDGDGTLDVVVAAYESGRNALHAVTFQGVGNATFQLQQDTTIGEATFDAVADIDADGHPDIAYHDASMDQVEFVASGSGFGFDTTPYAIVLPDTASSLQLADLNADGRPDLIFKSDSIIYIVPSAE